MALEVVAVRLQRPRVALARADLGLEAVKPPARYGREAQARRDRHRPLPGRRDESQPFAASGCEVIADGPETRVPAWRQHTAYLPLGWR